MEEKNKKEVEINVYKLIGVLVLVAALIVAYGAIKEVDEGDISIPPRQEEPEIIDVDDPEVIEDIDEPYQIEETGNETGIDDWNKDVEPTYSPSGSWSSGISFNSITSSAVDSTNGGIFKGFNRMASMESDISTFAGSDETIGFSVGGAKDVSNFRENIKDGYFPISTDITYNGLFYDYYFDTGKGSEQKSEELFSPSYSTAISSDPISGQEEYYMTVGLNSNIKESDFVRKKLNLTVVLDISGSMGVPFSSYYYDGKRVNPSNRSKMDIANDSVCMLIDHLNEDDRFGMVLFESEAYAVKPLNLVKDVNMTAIKKHILDIKDTGGTNFEAGYVAANKLYEEYQNVNSDEYENRIIVITDAMPNTGDTSPESLLGMVKSNAEKGIYTTFIGVGVDFNTELIEEISDVRGANSYSVHYAKEFKERMDEQFDFMVTPLVFDLNLKLESDDLEIENVYGSDSQDMLKGEIMNVNTLFPSKSNSSGEVKGGIVLLKLKSKTNSSNSKVKVSVSYKDRKMTEHSNSQEVNFSSENEHYDNTGIRKAIVLTRYVNTIKNWILHERSQKQEYVITKNTGIFDCYYTPEEVYTILGEHERTSQPLSVSKEYKEIFKKLLNYMKAENKELDDGTLAQEFEILEKLSK